MWMNIGYIYHVAPPKARMNLTFFGILEAQRLDVIFQGHDVERQNWPLSTGCRWEFLVEDRNHSI